jgi:phospho-2-dehydro-3-deoxyheptonate aldolase
VHDVKSAMEYAHLLKAYADEAVEDLHILMRVYFEKVSSLEPCSERGANGHTL